MLPRLARFGTILLLCAQGAAACGGSGDAEAPQVDAPAPDGPSHATTTIFLNFDGGVFTRGFPDDPTANVSVFVRREGSTVPPWHAGMAGRDASIAAITAGVSAIFAPYDVDVVTTRPASGPYEMVMFGGDARALFGAGPLDLMGGGDCNDGPDISFVTEAVTDDEVAASLAVGSIARARFMPITTVHGDCLCLIHDGCLPYSTELCSVGRAGTPTYADGPGCGGLRPAPPPTFDEHAYFVDRFGAR